MKKLLLGAVMTASMMFAQGAVAQEANAVTASFDVASIATACSGGDAVVCLAVIEAIIAALQAAGLTPGELNSQIALLASSLADVARDNPVPAVLAATSQALGSVAAASTDPAQIAAIQTLAADVAANNIPDQTTVPTTATLSGA